MLEGADGGGVSWARAATLGGRTLFVIGGTGPAVEVQGPAYKEDAPDAGDLDGDEPGEYVDEDDHYWLVTELECAGSVAAGTLWGRAVIASIGVDGGTLR